MYFMMNLKVFKINFLSLLILIIKKFNMMIMDLLSIFFSFKKFYFSLVEKKLEKSLKERC